MNAVEYIKRLSDYELIMLARVAILEVADFTKENKHDLMLYRKRYQKLEEDWCRYTGRYDFSELLTLELADRLERAGK